MLQGEHSAILSTFIKLPFVFKILVLSIFEWPFYTGFTVLATALFVILVIIGDNFVSCYMKDEKESEYL